jgi:hypothetical protein
VAIVPQIVASRVNQPKEKQETKAQEKTVLKKGTRLLRGVIGLLTVINLCTLYFVMHHSLPLTPAAVLRIAIAVTMIGVCAMLWLSLSLFDFIRLVWHTLGPNQT